MKAILVLDEMPKCCGDCPCWNANDRKDWCGVTDNTLDGIDLEKVRPSWCPLKQMLEKIDISEQSDKDFDSYPDGEYLADKIVESQGCKRHGCCTDVYCGYNACIDELEGIFFKYEDDELDFSGFGGDWP